MKFRASSAAALTEYAKRHVGAKNFAGITWCLEHEGEVVEQNCVGHQDKARRRPMTPETIFRLYSMTKPVISAHCLQLIESGLLQLDDPITRWFPAFEPQQVLDADGQLTLRERSITIEDLLTHRAGFSYDFQPNCLVASEYRAACLASDGVRPLQDLTLKLAGTPLANQPGARWHYSYSTDVLASIIEHVNEKPLADCLYDAIFDPLNMLDTGFQVPAEKQARLAQMFGQRDLGEVAEENSSSGAEINPLRVMNVEESYPEDDAAFARGGIGLYSTVHDYRQFMQVLMSGVGQTGQQLLSRPMLDFAWQNRLSDSQLPIDIGGKVYPGYGWGLLGRVMLDTSVATRLTVEGEGGWAGAASTYFWVDRKNRFSGVVMAQYLGSEVTLGPDIQAIAYGGLGNLE